MRYARSLCGIALVAALAGCTDGQPAAAPPGPAGSGPAASVSGSVPGSVSGSAPAWTEPANYTFVVDRQCEGRPSLGKYRVTVAAGQVAGRERIDGKTASGEEEIEVPTLGGLVELAQAAADDGGTMKVEADPADGHPRLVSFDVSDESDPAAGEEAGTCFVISEYAPKA